jgi:tripartite-type tricarboxylate transporter receptor subunit TctC
MPNLAYDPIKDLAPVVRLVTTWGIVAVSASGPVKTLNELLTLAKRKPGTLRYGAGAAYAHILGELLGKRAGAELLYVPYKGDAQVLADLIGGHIDVMFSTPLLLVPQIKAGRVRALAVAGPRRLPALPDVPTMSELGVPNCELPAWAGICAPANTTATVVDRLNREAIAAMTSPEVKIEVEAQSYEVAPNTATDFLAFIKVDTTRTVALVKELNIPPEQ